MTASTERGSDHHQDAQLEWLRFGLLSTSSAFSHSITRTLNEYADYESARSDEVETRLGHWLEWR